MKIKECEKCNGLTAYEIELLEHSKFIEAVIERKHIHTDCPTCLAEHGKKALADIKTDIENISLVGYTEGTIKFREFIIKLIEKRSSELIE